MQIDFRSTCPIVLCNGCYNCNSLPVVKETATLVAKDWELWTRVAFETTVTSGGQCPGHVVFCSWNRKKAGNKNEALLSETCKLIGADGFLWNKQMTLKTHWKQDPVLVKSQHRTIVAKKQRNWRKKTVAMVTKAKGIMMLWATNSAEFSRHINLKEVKPDGCTSSPYCEAWLVTWEKCLGA